MERQMEDDNQVYLHDVQSFRKADFNINHYLVAAELRERLLISKLATQKFPMQRFYMKKLNHAELGIIMWTPIGLGKICERM